jgi:hypothetical protein
MNPAHQIDRRRPAKGDAATALAQLFRSFPFRARAGADAGAADDFFAVVITVAKFTFATILK